MSEVLARVRVRETAGIRRFLYPLSASVVLPKGLDYEALGVLTRDHDIDTTRLHLRTSSGVIVPLHVAYEGRPNEYGVDNGGSGRELKADFAVSLAPYEEQELDLMPGMHPASTVPDPLKIQRKKGQLESVQERVKIIFGGIQPISSVVYNGVEHLRGVCFIERNRVPLETHNGLASFPMANLLLARGGHSGKHEDSHWATQTAITACKSWATVTHKLLSSKPQDEVVFTLPLAVTSPTLTCDFGVGGYVFGKLDEKATEIVWRSEFGNAPYARWSVATAGRVDYVGEVDSAEAFLPQRWFHLIDSDKALAVAVTKLPNDCREMTVRLTHEGDVSIAFRLGETITGPAEFGVCYHFLNDVPAIAAATNPQSILLPPVVEVLPV